MVLGYSKIRDATSAVLLLLLGWCSDPSRQADVQCSANIEGLETCLEKLQKGNDFQLLKQKRQQIWNTCSQKGNNTFQPCLEQLQTVENCQQSIQSDSQIQTARKQLLDDFDQCFKQQFPFNPLIVLKPPAYGGPLQTPGGPLCPQLPPMAPAFMGMPPPQVPMQGMYGGDSNPHDEPHRHPGKGIHRRPANPDHSRAAGAGTDGHFNQGYPQCASFMDCVVQGELQLNSDATVTKAAKAVHTGQHKCLNENVPPYECTPGSPQIADCIATAHLSFEEVKQSVLLGCLQAEPSSHTTVKPTPSTAQPKAAGGRPRGQGQNRPPSNNKTQRGGARNRAAAAN